MSSKTVIFWMIVLLCIFCVMFSGCAYLHSTPTLKEGSIPYKLEAGVYKDVKGNKHLVTTNDSRWSVSESYIFDAVTKDHELTWKQKLNEAFPKPALITMTVVLTIVLLLKRRENT